MAMPPSLPPTCVCPVARAGIPRHLESRLLEAIEQYPIVTLTGPRQSGKTTLARLALPEHDYIRLEDPDQRRLAREDPRGFLSRFADARVILDQVQHVPELFSYMQGIVDGVSEKPR